MDLMLLEAVISGRHDRPKKLPSEVDMGVKTGLTPLPGCKYAEYTTGDTATAKSSCYTDCGD